MSNLKTFKIRYKDPETGEVNVTYQKYSDGPKVKAKEWAQDLGYTLSDRGWYRVEEVK